MRSGCAELPLHNGRAPKWLFSKMRELSGKISETIILEFSQKELIKRLSNPYFFQSFACVIGFDWHSSGATTTTCGALKESLNSLNLGLKVVGGKGRVSRKVKEELKKFELSDKNFQKLEKVSRLSAKVDNNCVQDNYSLYHHSLIFTEKGDWAVIQQGMNPKNKYARRYHWISDNLKNFVLDPQKAICCDLKENRALNLSSKKSQETQKISLDLIKDDPDHLRRYFQPRGQKSLLNFSSNPIFLKLPARHEILASDLTPRILKNLKKAYEIQPENYEELVSLKGIGKKSLRALALVASLVYGSESSWKDPVKYSYAHGGKDGFPYPVDEKVYSNSIQTLETALKQSEIGKKEKLNALQKLSKLEI